MKLLSILALALVASVAANTVAAARHPYHNDYDSWSSEELPLADSEEEPSSEEKPKAGKIQWRAVCKKFYKNDESGACVAVDEEECGETKDGKWDPEGGKCVDRLVCRGGKYWDPKKEECVTLEVKKQSKVTPSKSRKESDEDNE